MRSIKYVELNENGKNMKIKSLFINLISDNSFEINNVIVCFKEIRKIRANKKQNKQKKINNKD